MKQEPSDNIDPKRLENLPQLSLAEAAWMAGITPDSFARFLEAANLNLLRAIPVTDLLRASFTQLGQREAQLAMFRLQLTAALHREKELVEALHFKLTQTTTAIVPTPPPPPTPPAKPEPPTPAPALRPAFDMKTKKTKKKK